MKMTINIGTFRAFLIRYFDMFKLTFAMAEKSTHMPVRTFTHTVRFLIVSMRNDCSHLKYVAYSERC